MSVRPLQVIQKHLYKRELSENTTYLQDTAHQVAVNAGVLQKAGFYGSPLLCLVYRKISF